MEYKIKVTTGFGADEKFTIDAQEAHKAYYLFNNPDERGTFKNGVAITGSRIQGIMPDWHAIMGWNPTHKLNDDDWNEIKRHGIDTKMNNILSIARDVAKLAERNTQMLTEPLTQLRKALPENLVATEIKELSERFKP